ncbi:hypothetical protein BC629DRAFT_926911 [Irpex lacteus]|nr:hypothetical protein BC629DRAFT_926911 [Irpex lacteus]
MSTVTQVALEAAVLIDRHNPPFVNPTAYAGFRRTTSAMSNSSLTADAIEGIIANYVSFSTSALYIYEYFIVIDQEIALVWMAKWKLSTLLFLVNRYVALMVALVYTVPVVDYTTQARYAQRLNTIKYGAQISEHSCNAGVNLLKTATLVQFLVIAVFSTQRVFAVTSRTEYKYWLSALVFALGIVPIIVNVWTVAQEQLIYVPKSACTSFVVGYDEVLLRRLHLPHEPPQYWQTFWLSFLSFVIIGLST